MPGTHNASTAVHGYTGALVCMFAYSGCVFKFQPETLLLIQFGCGSL